MIRKAELKDLSHIAMLYDSVIDFQSENGNYMSWQKGVYPTKETAELGFSNNTLYVYELDGIIRGSMILDFEQSEEYLLLNWLSNGDSQKALIIHTLCVDPNFMGLGIASEMLEFTKALASQLGCSSIRLATNSKNLAAIRLYEKNGFSTVGFGRVLLDSKIECPRQCFMEYVI